MFDRKNWTGAIQMYFLLYYFFGAGWHPNPDERQGIIYPGVLPNRIGDESVTAATLHIAYQFSGLISAPEGLYRCRFDDQGI